VTGSGVVAKREAPHGPFRSFTSRSSHWELPRRVHVVSIRASIFEVGRARRRRPTGPGTRARKPSARSLRNGRGRPSGGLATGRRQSEPVHDVVEPPLKLLQEFSRFMPSRAPRVEVASNCVSSSRRSLGFCFSRSWTEGGGLAPVQAVLPGIVATLDRALVREAPPLQEELHPFRRQSRHFASRYRAIGESPTPAASGRIRRGDRRHVGLR